MEADEVRSNATGAGISGTTAPRKTCSTPRRGRERKNQTSTRKRKGR